MAASSSGVRPASGQDAGACPAIYRPCVQNTAISWGIDVPTVDEMLARIEGLRATHEWLILARDDSDHRSDSLIRGGGLWGVKKP